MSWNAFAGALGGAQKTFAEHLARKQVDLENAQKAEAMELERRRVLASIAADERRGAAADAELGLTREKFAFDKAQVERKSALDTLGGLVAPTKDANLAKLAQTYAPHLLEEREGLLPTRSAPTALMGAKGGPLKAAGFTAPTAGEEAGTYVNPYVSAEMKATLLSLQQKDDSQELLNQWRQGKLDMDRRELEQRTQVAMERLGYQKEMALAAAERARYASDAAAARNAAADADRQLRAYQFAISQASKDVDPSSMQYMSLTPDQLNEERNRRINTLLGRVGNPPAPTYRMGAPIGFDPNAPGVGGGAAAAAPQAANPLGLRSRR